MESSDRNPPKARVPSEWAEQTTLPSSPTWATRVSRKARKMGVAAVMLITSARIAVALPAEFHWSAMYLAPGGAPAFTSASLKPANEPRTWVGDGVGG